MNRTCKLVLGVGLALCAMAAIMSPPEASAQVVPTEVRLLSGLPASIAASSVSNINTTITLRQDRNLAFALLFNTSGAGTDNVTVWAYPSVDGTNFATASPIVLQVPANGATAVVAPKNVPKADLEGYRALKFTMISNASASRVVYPTNLIYGWRP